MTGVAPSPTRARSRIYRTALRLFAETGTGEISVSDLAQAAGVARGTIYNNLKHPENLFADVASALSHEMIGRVDLAVNGIKDPVERLAVGIRLFVRRAHEDHDWGRFVVSFAANHQALRRLMREPPVRDIALAIESGRFKVDRAKIPPLVSMLSGSTLAAMNSVIVGDQTWRDAGSDTAELFLRAGGLSAAEAKRLSRTELPSLPPAQRTTTRKTMRGKS